jgi:hypothetical protein
LHRLVIHARAVFSARLLYEQGEIARIHDNALIGNDGFQFGLKKLKKFARKVSTGKYNEMIDGHFTE